MEVLLYSAQDITPFIVAKSRRYVMLSYIYIYILNKKHEYEKANYRQDLLMMIIIIILKYKIVLEFRIFIYREEYVVKSSNNSFRLYFFFV